jgi:ATP-dependent DNA helicase RecQ
VLSTQPRAAEEREWVALNAEAFDLVRLALRGAPATWPGEGLHSRLRDAVEGWEAGVAGVADVAVLVGAVLRRAAELGHPNPSLEAPLDGPWPGPDEWRRFGVAAQVGSGGTQLWGMPWSPGWLDGGTAPFADIDAATQRRLEAMRLPADPFFTSITGFEEYSSEGQRTAVRAFSVTAEGSTTLAVLPTGRGKTAIADVAALVPWLSGGRGTALVVVPTTALALDQERAFADLLDRTRRPSASRCFAYHADLTDSAKKNLRQRVSSGEQIILFTSPEALERSLAVSLYRAAGKGLVAAFVVDEAHVVSEWGDEFRPEFQSIGGLRRGLLREAQAGGYPPFRTLLLTATPTADAIQTLRQAFSDPDTGFGVVSAAELRPEPSYWAHEFATSEERAAGAIEALRHLPRPLLVYTSKPEDAEEWFALFRAEGFRRLALVTGKSRAGQRRDALDGWRGIEVGRRTRQTRYDIVVATSAFGLGVDQEDVRAVVHLCLPETIDRFYQDVGRGGRDGRAMVSLLLAAPGDDPIAASLNQTKLITRDLAQPRIKAMLGDGERLESGEWRVDLAIPPDHVGARSDFNLKWNQRTVNLLVRAGRASWEGMPPASEERGRELKADPDSWGGVVRLFRHDWARDEFWRDVEDTRTRRVEADDESLKAVHATLEDGACVHRILRDALTIEMPELWIRPAESCGGCAWCRQHPTETPVARADIDSTTESVAELRAQLAEWATAGETPVIHFSENAADWRTQVRRAVEAAVADGVMTVALPDDADLTAQLRSAAAKKVTFFESAWTPLSQLANLPSLFVISQSTVDALSAEHLLGGHDVPEVRMLVVEQRTPDPLRPDRLLCDMRRSMPIEHFLVGR